MEVIRTVAHELHQRPLAQRDPFPWVVLDGLFDRELVYEASQQWPSPDPANWTVNYQNALERKRALNEYARMPPPCVLLLGQLCAMDVWQYFPALAHPPTPDLSLRGGGLHSMGRGEHLDLHEDSDHHPTLGWERRINGVLFLNPHWVENWHGALELWDERFTRHAKIYPQPNRLVLFAIGDRAYHGVPTPLACPEDMQRKSLAAFWFTPPEPMRPFKRPRAKFVAYPGEQHHPEKEWLRAQRAQLE